MKNDTRGAGERFAERKRTWFFLSVTAAAVLLFSIMSSTFGKTTGTIQWAGLAGLVTWALASFVLCRCPECRHGFGSAFMQGWRVRECPKCHANMVEPTRGQRKS